MNVMDAARNVAEDYPGGAKALAARIDKNPTTLSHELKETGDAKLGLVTAVKMSDRSKDLRILNAFAAELGCMVLPLPAALLDEGVSEGMRHLAESAKEYADVVQQVAARIGDGISDNDMDCILREWGEHVAAGQRLIRHLEGLRQAGRPGYLRAVGQ